MNNRKSAGIILFSLGVFPIISWLIFFTVGNSTCQTWADNLEFILAKENQFVHIFYSSVVFGTISIIASIAYFSKASNSRIVLLTLFIFCVIQAIVAVIFTTFDTSIIYLVSVFTGYMAYKNPNKALKRDSAKNAVPLS